MVIFLNRKAIAQQHKFMKFESGTDPESGITDPDQDPIWPFLWPLKKVSCQGI
jgi:hypothetical protein